MEEPDSAVVEELCSFVSSDIFEFLLSESSTSNSNFRSAPTATNTANDPYPQVEPHPLEAAVNKLLLECSMQYESELLGNPGSSGSLHQHSTIGEIFDRAPPKRPFAPPKTEPEISKAKDDAVPHKTVQDKNYCVGLWNQWCSHRTTMYGDSISSLDKISAEELAHHISNFVFEICKKDGSEFPPDSIHHM